MTPDVAKVDADRDLKLGLSAWDFSDEVLRWLIHGTSLRPPSEDLLIEFIVRIWRLLRSACHATQKHPHVEAAICS
ncbi:hypothetical protein ACPOL_6234 [Acidisarcina polymorpha]|uniref:Uncharacterized protein n=1 Tax=Acidisarcina polymorpha TaxID=2211140 RepID=A0A2Z5GA70_9BACT|nr:hypothetical protein [Acidisarcina polymorpha]AXC15475.1 hypothetical protein ACPOL_6234 [Acidisarcina polymorpha]